MEKGNFARLGALSALVLAGAAFAAPQESSGRPRPYPMGFTVIPYDATPEAMTATLDFVKSHGDLISFRHVDGGVPWIDALKDRPFPDDIEEKWRRARNAVPEGFKVFITLTPLNGDKSGLAGLSSEGEPGPAVEAAWASRVFNDPEVIRAYSTYCLRAVKILKPDYLCIAHECTRILVEEPKLWEGFARFCWAVRMEIRKNHPDLKVGVSHVLPLLWNQQIARAVRLTLKDLDFLGISFFPYAGLEAELHGGRALPRGRDQWLAPLRWARGFAGHIPLAVCDTAYTTRDVELAEHRLRLQGDPQVQKQYVADLLALAVADKYLFVVWQLPIDCERLAAAFPLGAQEIFRIIMYNGLAGSDLKPKPALEIWDRELSRNPRPK